MNIFVRSGNRLGGLFIMLSVIAGCAAARGGTGLTDRSWDEIDAEIRASTQASADAWNAGDLPGHLAIYVDTVTFMTADGPRPGVDAVEEAFQSTYFEGGRPRQNLRFESVEVRPLGRDAALQTGRFILSGGGEPERSGWFTLVWVRTESGWRAVHDHTS